MKTFILTAAAVLLTPQHSDIILKKVNHRGDVFPGFIEVMDQPYLITQDGSFTYKLNGEMAEVLLNIDSIRRIVRFEDSKKNDYACLVWFEEEDKPLLIRKEYKDLKAAIKKATTHGR